MSDKHIDTLILRFRDLVTENDETIRKHKEIIKTHGYVWWAWWKKGHEITPIDNFGGLSARAEESPITFFLIDSGQEKVYRAVCNNIKCAKDKEIPSPETKKTPSYYNERQYFAWFKLTSIEECEDNELKNYSYVNVDALFKEGTSDYSLFNKKMVFGTLELIQQNRTVWFVRKYEKGDRDNEIVLLNSSLVQPHNFSEKYYETLGNTILWLSDLHFPERVFTVKEVTSQTTLTQHIKRCCTEFYDIGSLVITGDITSYGKAEGFEIAKDFIQDLNRETSTKLKSENIIFCPGNHDFTRKEEILNSGETPELVTAGNSSVEAFSKFYHDIHNIYPNKYISSGRKLLLPLGQTVEIASLNSLMLQQYKNFEGHGYISEEQLNFVAKEMKWEDEYNSSSIRVVIMHHHYLPTCFKEIINVTKPSSIVYDADCLMHWLVKHNVKLLLHGHKHNSFVSKVSYPKEAAKNFNLDELKNVTVIGMGGTGAKDSENKFATISFELQNIVIKYYKIYKDDISNDSCDQTITIPYK